jgi:hypothetical protein
MTAAGSITFQIALAVVFVIGIAYSAGRVHQWYRHTFEKDVAYREGYNQASRTLFHLAVRNPSGKGTVPPAAASADLDAAGTPLHTAVPFPGPGPQRSNSDLL